MNSLLIFTDLYFIIATMFMRHRNLLIAFFKIKDLVRSYLRVVSRKEVTLSRYAAKYLAT